MTDLIRLCDEAQLSDAIRRARIFPNANGGIERKRLRETAHEILKRDICRRESEAAERDT